MPCNANKCCPMLLSSGQRLWCVMNSSVDTVLAKLSVLVESHGLTVEHKDLGCPCMPTHGGKRFIPSVFLGSSPPYILRQCLPLKRELTSSWTSWPASPGILLPRCLQCWGTGVHCHIQLCIRVNSDPNSFSH